jgi:transitional endoplasmic reticulum ATPase
MVLQVLLPSFYYFSFSKFDSLLGTGKSEIMSKLSTKLGVAMVGPPLAAGELNRPLVGESERVIIALASRCHRVPYAMCCLSIDEIDSLAPKRDEDSSEGKVDKISVLLSLIDGIKDVPNLMIFCATNRLNMMDEAFLRRMSGKFFVGRPSSEARRKILAEIPKWALELDLIDELALASTNFSGAACK